MGGRRLLAIGGFGLALILVVWFQLRPVARSLPRSTIGEDEPASVAAELVPARSMEGETVRRELAVQETANLAGDVRVSDPRRDDAPSDLVPLRGRMLDMHGAPLAGQNVVLQGYCVRGSPAGAYRMRTDAAGEFSALIRRPGSGHVSVDRHECRHSNLTGSHALLWAGTHDCADFTRWCELEVRDGNVDLGDIVARGGRLEGVVRADFALADPASWSVCVVPRLADLPGYVQRRSVGTSPDASGAFTLKSLPAGAAVVSLAHPLFGVVVEQPVEIAEDGTTRVELVYRGPDPSRQLLVSLETDARILPEQVWLQDSRGRTYTPSSVQLFPGAFEWAAQARCMFEGLEDGEYQFVYAQPASEDFILVGLRAGQRVDVPLPSEGDESEADELEEDVLRQLGD